VYAHSLELALGNKKGMEGHDDPFMSAARISGGQTTQGGEKHRLGFDLSGEKKKNKDPAEGLIGGERYF